MNAEKRKLLLFNKGRKPKDLVIEEIKACMADPIYFLNSYGKVQHPKKGKIKLKLYDFQESTIEDYEKHRFNIILKSRQMGLSTITAGYIAWIIMFFQAKHIAVVANKREVAQNFIKKVNTYIMATPSWLRPSITRKNMSTLQMANGSIVTAHATTSDAARSESLSLLVIDEAAIIDTKKVDELWTSAYPTLFLGGKAIIISTPKGVGNFYHKQWEIAQNPDSEFNPIYLHWTQHPEYSKDMDTDETGAFTSPWYEKQKVELGDPRKVAQELDCEFGGSGNNVISEEFMRNVQATICAPFRVDTYTICDKDYEVSIWKNPVEDVKYLISADVARGDAADFSAFFVRDVEKNEQVAGFKQKIPPDDYATLLLKVGLYYNIAMIACESNSIGHTTCTELKNARLPELDNTKYPNLFYSIPAHFNIRGTEKIQKDIYRKEKLNPGFETTPHTRPIIVDNIEKSIRTNTIIIRDQRLYSELKTFIWVKHNKAAALRGYNDDYIFAMGIGETIKDVHIKALQDLEESAISALNSIGKQVTDLPNNGVFNSTPHNVGGNPWKIALPNGEEEDLTWLLKG